MKSKNSVTAEKISNDIKRLCEKSKVVSSPKQAISDVLQVSFNMLFNREFMSKGRQHGINRCHLSEFYVSLDKYKEDLESWEMIGNIASDYLALIASKPFATDVLSEILEPYANTELGQFLSPSDVADVMVAVQMTDFDEKFQRQQIYRTGDITGSGTGSLLLAILRHVYKTHGRQGVALLDISACDIDRTMCLATVCQLELASIIHQVPYFSLSVWFGNAITQTSLMYVSVPDCKRFDLERMCLITKTILHRGEAKTKVANDPIAADIKKLA